MVARVVEDIRPGRYRLQVDWPGEYYAVSCPYCSDTRQRLWINHRWGKYVPELKLDNLFLAICFNEDCLKRSGRALHLPARVFDDFVRGGRPDPVLPGRPPDPAARTPEPPG